MRKLCGFLQELLNLADAAIILAASPHILADVSYFLAIWSWILAEALRILAGTT
nr:hypothetical protein [Paenibacillus bovis]